MKHGGTLTVSKVGAIGAGDFGSPVLVPGRRLVIVAIATRRAINGLKYSFFSFYLFLVPGNNACIFCRYHINKFDL